MRTPAMFTGAITLALAVIATTSAVNAQEQEGMRQMENVDRARVQQEIDRARSERQAREVTRTSTASAIVRKFRKTGRPAMLGIAIDNVEDGVTVARVSRDGPADQSGIKKGDLIVAVNGVALTTRQGLSAADVLIGEMEKLDPSHPVSVKLTVRRAGSPRNIEVAARALETRRTNVL